MAAEDKGLGLVILSLCRQGFTELPLDLESAQSSGIRRS